ncbi:hypothetical protein I6I08_06290 [Actinomyces oris]|uniref:Uncharacterized protein n=2 Tax=Actinomyces oris TaxID=544580 RepID=A0A1Q8WVM0_9ACTO|nr:hypothetical protein BKH19_03400 [Actinomyces oris]QQC40844.1 hypothetical protein I6I08_06290 [Actinomyces oris]TQD60703.1 hypothetical protein FK267_09880 [Actinomyces oris]
MSRLHKGMTVIHTMSMTGMTTIKVERSTRDGLRALASERGVTMDTALKELLEEAARERRFAEVRRAMEVHPPDETYLNELRDWESEAWS